MLLFDVMDCTPKNHRMSSKVSKRLTESTAPEVCEHIYTPRLNRDFSAGFPLLCDINQAHLLMLKTAGLISADDARQLANAMMQMEVDGPAKVPLDPLLEDAYFNFEAHLMRIAGAHVGGSLHMARSRNDILATMDRMRARELVLATLQALGQLQASALEGALRYAHVVMPGYTHLQPAQPVSYGYYLLAIAEAVERDSARMLALLPDLALCPLGAGALAGTSFPILRDVSAAALGFTGTVPTALDAVASRDYAMELLSSMAISAVGCSRFAQDYFVWCTHEFGLIDFPDSVAGTSSIMPQKKNPVVLEFIKGKSGQLIGLSTAALSTFKGVNYTHTGDGNREGMRNLWDASQEFLRLLDLMKLVVQTATPNTVRMKECVSHDFSVATELADLLVRERGLSFREAHHVVGDVVRRAMNAGLSSNAITSELVDEAARSQLDQSFSLDADQLRNALDPSQSIQKKGGSGGPAPEQVRHRAAELQVRLALRTTRVNSQVQRLTDTRQQLKKDIAALAQS